ncbi:MAG: hypothetical protein D6733_00515 [Methanobacteriota archaeon]|nr:MAG: hypothetical protein D6733_00515 [Euryarchaeota archaeon]
MTMAEGMIGFTGLRTVELGLLFVLTGWLLYLAYLRKEEVLSPAGRERVYERRGTAKMGVLFSLVSMIFFLEAESAEILSLLFPGAFRVDLAGIQGYAEALHLFMLLLALASFLTLFQGGGDV